MEILVPGKGDPKIAMENKSTRVFPGKYHGIG